MSDEEWVAFPSVTMGEAGSSTHDMLVGPCGCGAWHTLDDWPHLKPPKEQDKQ